MTFDGLGHKHKCLFWNSATLCSSWVFLHKLASKNRSSPTGPDPVLISIFRSECPRENYFYFNLSNSIALMNQDEEFNCTTHCDGNNSITDSKFILSLVPVTLKHRHQPLITSTAAILFCYTTVRSWLISVEVRSVKWSSGEHSGMSGSKSWGFTALQLLMHCLAAFTARGRYSMLSVWPGKSPHSKGLS